MINLRFFLLTFNLVIDKNLLMYEVLLLYHHSEWRNYCEDDKHVYFHTYMLIEVVKSCLFLEEPLHVFVMPEMNLIDNIPDIIYYLKLD